MNLQTRKPGFESELPAAEGKNGGCGWGEWIVREFEIDMYILLYFKWITNKDLLYNT